MNGRSHVRSAGHSHAQAAAFHVAGALHLSVLKQAQVQVASFLSFGFAQGGPGQTETSFGLNCLSS